LAASRRCKPDPVFRLAPLATAASAGAHEYFCTSCANPSARTPENCKRL
jgi:hypothetical protein